MRRDLPEPAELHAKFSQVHPLDWGDPIPSAAEIAAEFGEKATAESLELLRRMLDHHDEVTRQLLEAVGPGLSTHELEHRVKSPASLARKIWKFRGINARPPLDDVLRFTIVAGGSEVLVDSVRDTVTRLREAGWRVQSAHQSYVDGSRYKGIHAFPRTGSGVVVEVQFHSKESIRVKMQTTGLYHAERDPRQSKQVRDAAAAEAVRLSATMTQPFSLDQLTHLDGAPVEARRYGYVVRQKKQQTSQDPSAGADQSAHRQRQRDHGIDGRNG